MEINSLQSKSSLGGLTEGMANLDINDESIISSSTAASNKGKKKKIGFTPFS